SFVNRRDHSFVWSNYSIIDTEVIDELICIGRAEIHALHLALASHKFEPVSPDVSGITHERAPAGKKHRRVVHRRVNDQSSWRCLLFYKFRKAHSSGIKH